ncbi:opsin-5-like [Ptychodera flava]|uniref:opsin-5-like n=1 Tax=Ptychodera flava TaxID=63121 RepID=UPI003969F126
MTIQEASTSTANDSNPNYESKLSATSDIFIGVVMAATVFVSIFGNTVVVCLTWKQRKKLKPMDYMIVNLALTDIGIALLGYPFAVLAAFNHRWNSGDIGCKWYGFIGLFFGASSIICMSCLAFFRYMKICQEHRGAKLTKKDIGVYFDNMGDQWSLGFFTPCGMEQLRSRALRTVMYSGMGQRISIRRRVHCLFVHFRLLLAACCGLIQLRLYRMEDLVSPS